MHCFLTTAHAVLQDSVTYLMESAICLKKKKKAHKGLQLANVAVTGERVHHYSYSKSMDNFARLTINC